MTMAVIAAVAEFERDLLIERTQAGLNRAKAEGKRLGRPAACYVDAPPQFNYLMIFRKALTLAYMRQIIVSSGDAARMLHPSAPAYSSPIRENLMENSMD